MIHVIFDLNTILQAFFGSHPTSPFPTTLTFLTTTQDRVNTRAATLAALLG